MTRTSAARRKLATILSGSVVAICLFVPPAGASETRGAGKPPTRPANVFSLVTAKARALASKPYQPPQGKLPDALAKLGYDQYHDIRFKRDKALWRNQSLFAVEFFHLGFLYKYPVKINVVENGQIKPVPFDPSLFDYGKNAGLPSKLPKDLGYAGFRIHYPLNRPNYKDEVIAFLGASYFRMLGRGQTYGMSARGLAIDTATQEGEEFPRFSEFWLEKPAPKATSVTFYALLDSPSATGAYRFRLSPGAHTVLDVAVRLFPRTDIDKVGIAPLTSMFLYGENSVRRFDDYRPEVHDSDGLLMHSGAGEWIWRPLTNPHGLQVFSFEDDNPKGFGLAQRDRDFSHYLDPEASYSTRPSLWVTPSKGWGKGTVELIEIPTDEEINDNIVAFWVPAQPFKGGQERSFSYRLETFGSTLPGERLGRVKRTRTGWGAIPGATNKPPHSFRQFIVDFAGGELKSLAASQPLQAKLSTSSGTISDLAVRRLPGGHTWRAAFKLKPDGKQPSDMRLYLTLRGRRLTETWSYVWNPDAIQ